MLSSYVDYYTVNPKPSKEPLSGTSLKYILNSYMEPQTLNPKPYTEASPWRLRFFGPETTKVKLQGPWSQNDSGLNGYGTYLIIPKNLPL